MTIKFKTVRLSILFFSSFFILFGTSKIVRADCTQWHSHHCGIKDLKRESEDAIEQKIVAKKRFIRRGNNLGDKIQSNVKMPQGSFLQSKDGRFRMVVQGDGNLVIYQQGNSIWASNTAGKGSPKFELAVQNDGNVVLYGRNAPTWASNTNGVGIAPYTLVMQNDGNLVLYDRRNTSIWQSDTCCR